MTDQVRDPPQAVVQDNGGEPIRTYPELIAALADRRKALGLNQLDACDVIGTPDGYVGQVECFSRVATWQTLETWLEALGVGLVLVPLEGPPGERARRLAERFRRRREAEKTRRARAEKGKGRSRHDRECCPDPEAIQHFPGRAA